MRSAATAPSTWSDGDRSFEFVLATPQPVLRWYRDCDTWERFQAEEVLPTETAVLMDESGRSIPILNSHQSWSVESVVGVVTEMRREDGKIVCKGRLSGRDSVADVVEGVREGVLRNLSVGYDTPDMELVTDAVTGKKTMRAKRWTILEASLVPVPADGNAQVRSAHDLVVDWRRSNNTEETDMTEEQVTALATAAARAVLDEDRKAREAAEAEKRSKEPSTEVTTTTTAPATSERSAEDTAAIAGLRSAAVSYGCEAGFDAMDKAGATVAELRSMVASGARKHSNTPDIDGGSSMGGSRHAEQLPDFGTAFRSAFGGGTK